MEKHSKTIETYGLKYFHATGSRHFKRSYAKLCQELDALVSIPPTQFEDDGTPIVQNENKEDLEQYQIGYVKTVEAFKEHLKQFEPDSCSYHDPLQKLIDHVYSKLDTYVEQSSNPRDKSEEWYADGAMLACCDILDGTTI